MQKYNSFQKINKWIESNEARNRLYINKEQYFNGLSNAVFTYSIGGYQVIKKYIEARVDKTLTSEEISHIQNICGILADTIKLQEDIEKIDFLNL